MGCGRVGSTLARSLEDRNHTVSVIDSNPDAFRRLGPSFDGTKVTGYGFDQAVLTEAGIERADAFAAVTSGDNSNIIAARVARETFGIQQVVARIYDPGRAEVYQRLGITTVATVKWTADQVLRAHPPGRRRARLPRPVGHDPRRPGARARCLGGPPHGAVPGAVRLPDRLDRPARRGHAADPRDRDAGGRHAPPGHAGARMPTASTTYSRRARRPNDARRHRRSGAVGRSIARELIGNGHEVLLIDKDPASIKPDRVPDARVAARRLLRALLAGGGPAAGLRRGHRRDR